jgi:hypothetical protein
MHNRKPWNRNVAGVVPWVRVDRPPIYLPGMLAGWLNEPVHREMGRTDREGTECS